MIQSTGPHFYSRPCGRGDERRRDGEDDLWEISTHAPAGGATDVVYIIGHNVNISTHAPAGGATGAEYQGKTGEELFLLTPLREGRRQEAARLGGFLVISTHAPAGGATYSSPKPSPVRTQFLLTPLREGRLLCFLIASTVVSLFLLTPLREGRQKLATVSMYSFAISTHAPAGGAT